MTRRFQFSLRALLIAVTACAVYLGIKADQAWRERQAAQEIRMLGWWAIFDSELPNQPTLSLAQRALGGKVFAYVVEVKLAGCRRPGAAMKQLKHFRRLERLDLNNSAVTDSDLADLPSLRHLRALDLSGTEISDVGLGQLKRHTGLRLVRIANTRVTDRGVAELVGQLPNSEITTRALVVPATDSDIIYD